MFKLLHCCNTKYSCIVVEREGCSRHTCQFSSEKKFGRSSAIALPSIVFFFAFADAAPPSSPVPHPSSPRPRLYPHQSSALFPPLHPAFTFRNSRPICSFSIPLSRLKLSYRKMMQERTKAHLSDVVKASSGGIGNPSAEGCASPVASSSKLVKLSVEGLFEPSNPRASSLPPRFSLSPPAAVSKLSPTPGVLYVCFLGTYS